MADANPVAAKLKEVSKKLGATVVIDGPSEESALDDFVKSNGGPNVLILYPEVKISANNSTVLVPMSSVAAGILARIRFWESPSNQEALNILGTSVPISFSLSDGTSKGQVLNGKQIATIVRQDGFRLWGARGSGDSTDLKTNQIQKVRIRDAVREAILANHRWAVAKGITGAYFETVAESVNTFLENLKREGAIAGGKCYPDKEANTPANINSGKASWAYEITPTPVAETLFFTETITDKYLTKIGA